MIRLNLFVLTLLFFPAFLIAQRTGIKGVVTDEDGNPVEGVKVEVGSYFTLSDESGNYDLDFFEGKEIVVLYSNFGYETDTAKTSLKKGELKTVNKQIKLLKNFLKDIDIVDKKSRFDNQVNIDTRNLDAYVGPGSGVEGILKTFAGVSSNNELSSQYSVRGGNFDENLVYVNGIEVYRPFLVRNGQQEGLSFVNSAMVSNIKFSAGGFEARYGDKMSSVLDITYKQPTEFGLRVEGSLLGGGITYEDLAFNKRLSVLASARYRTNQLLLGSLDTEADFRPQYTDFQAYLTYYLSDEWEVSFLGNYARNIYQVVPSVRTTDFGTFSEALRLTVFFEGMEDYDFTTRFGALSTRYKPNKELQLNFTASAFQTSEQEYFDVIGAYRLGELNNNLGSDDFGDISFIRGTGGFQNYARNYLDAIVTNIGHNGIYDKGSVTWRWGATLQYEDIIDTYKEWERIDSAGYSIPHDPSFNYDSLVVTAVDGEGTPRAGLVYTSLSEDDSLTMFESFDSRATVNSVRLMGYVERSQIFELDSSDIYLNIGLRSNYWSYNNQNVVSPRASVSWKPNNWDKDMVFRFSTGFYYQPPFYREMRNLDGGLNENIRAQKSIHFVLGNDYQLRIWNRPFKMVTEVYYKHMDDLIPYDLDNVRIRYRAVNNSKGYATGIDYRINGEFVKGVESWASVSLMTIKEDIANDGAGYLPRPTDQLFNFKIFFQDYLPKDPTFRVNLLLALGTGLPFGPPQAEAKDKNFRLPPYRRVDLGFNKVLKVEGKTYDSAFLNSFKSLWVGVEIFNLLQTSNTISYLWVKDVSTAREYAVPNYLTSRLLNVKVVASF